MIFAGKNANVSSGSNQLNRLNLRDRNPAPPQNPSVFGESRKEDTDDDLNDRARDLNELPSLENAHVPHAERGLRAQASKDKFSPFVTKNVRKSHGEN